MGKDQRSNYRQRQRRRRARRRTLFAAFFVAAAILFAIPVCALTANAQTARPDLSRKYYSSILVMPGDTLDGIARRYADAHYDSLEDYVKEVRFMNHLADGEGIDAGAYLIVPYYTDL